jgi:inosine triphosphate pyrophosphatase
MTLYFITGNNEKFKEIKKIISEIKQLKLDLIEIQELDSKKVIEHKLNEARKIHDGEFIVEDTSLYLNCIPGLPGPLIKWFMKTLDNDGIYELCKKYNNYNAKAKVVIGYSKNKKQIHFFEGVIEGKIKSPRGSKRFSWDRIFCPNGYEKTFSEMNIEEKNKISMRIIAVNKLKKFLDKNKIIKK